MNVFVGFKYLLCLRWQMSAVGITENVKGDVKKFEIWYSGREEVYVIQVNTFKLIITPKQFCQFCGSFNSITHERYNLLLLCKHFRLILTGTHSGGEDYLAERDQKDSDQPAKTTQRSHCSILNSQLNVPGIFPPLCTLSKLLSSSLIVLEELCHSVAYSELSPPLSVR